MTLTASPRSDRALPSGAAPNPRPVLGAVVGTVLAVLASVLLAPAASASGTTAEEPAWVRPAHLVPGLGSMDIRLSPFSGEGSSTPAEDRPLLETTAGYGAVGEYDTVPAGSYAVSVRPAGTPVAEPPLLSLTIDLEPGQAYTVAGLGSKDEPRLERLVDDLTPPAEGSASVRLLPASATAPVVDVQAEGGPVLAQGAALGEPTAYRATPAGSWTVRASGAGTSGATDLELAGGNVYTLLVLDAEDGGLVVEPVVDAVGIGVMPVGGAATGTGVPTGQGVPVVWSAVVGLTALAAGLLVLVARRPAVLPARSHDRSRAVR